MKNTMNGLILVLSLGLLVSACGTPVTATPTLPPAATIALTATPAATLTAGTTVEASATARVSSATEASVTTEGAYKPLDLQFCQEIHDAVTKALQVRFTLIDAPFTDPVTGETGMACTMEADTDGTSFENGDVSVIMDDLVVPALDGWTFMPEYQADGPTWEGRGYKRDQWLVLVNVEWTPSTDANCPSDQPIASCTVTPEQKLYQITLQAAVK